MGKWKLNSVGDRFKSLSHVSDEGLLQRYSRGNSHAFEVLYRRYKNRIFAFLRRQCHNRAIAEELTHDTWLAVIAKVNSNSNQNASYQHSVKKIESFVKNYSLF